MARASKVAIGVRIGWPRPDGETALWADLCLARALKASVGRPVHPTHLDCTLGRLAFERWLASDPVADVGPVLMLKNDDDDAWGLDLVGQFSGRRLTWRPDFVRFLGAVEADRLLALAALTERPMWRTALRFGAQVGLDEEDLELLCVPALVRSDEALQELLSRIKG